MKENEVIESISIARNAMTFVTMIVIALFVVQVFAVAFLIGVFLIFPAFELAKAMKQALESSSLKAPT